MSLKTNSELDVNFVRNQFPSFNDIISKNIIFMENADVGKVDANARQVTEVMGMTPFHGDPSQGMH